MRTELRLALRALLARPMLTVTAILALALGTGAAVLVFTVVNGVLLRALPFERADRVVVARSRSEQAHRDDAPLSWLELRELRASTGVFAHLGALDFEYPDLTGVAEPAQLRLGRVSGDVFAALGVHPMLGRTFTAEEMTTNPPVVLLGEGVWQQQFGGDPRILGKAIRLDGQPVTVVGVMPRVRLGATEWDAWRPADPARLAEANGEFRTLTVVGRLADGATPAQADALLRTLGQRLSTQNPRGNGEWTLRATPLRDYEVADRRAPLLVLLGATGLVLLVACANVAHLLLARGEQRRREMAIRTALGARRARLVRQALTESVLLASIGTALGLAMAVVLRPRLLDLSPLSQQQRESVTFDGAVLLAAIVAAVGTGLLFGMWPAIAGSRAEAQEAMRSGGRGTTGAGVWRSRGVLVVSEIALACVLVTGAALLARSFREVAGVSRGYDPTHVARAGMVLPDNLYPTLAAKQAFVDRVEASLRAVPGVQSVGMANFPPNYGGVPARAKAGAGEEQPVSWRVATPGFFEALRIPLLKGRGFDAGDAAKAGKVALVSAGLAKRLFGDADPIGRELSLQTWGPAQALRIVGVVGDVRQDGRQKEVAQDVWQPYSQVGFGYVNLMVRSDRLTTEQLIPAMRSAILAADRQRPIFDYGSLEERTGSDVGAERFAATLMLAFAGIAALLAAIGVAGVMALAVAARTREIGIRVALGGTPADVMRHVVRPGLRVVAAGAAIGLVLAVAGGRVLASQLHGISARDPLSLAGALLVTGVAGALACWLPARRALRVEPSVALRAD